MPFCAHCGSAVGAVKFCSKCGARVPEALAAAPTPPAPPPAQPPGPSTPAPNPAVAPAAQGGNVLMKVLVGFLVFILLIVLAVMGSCVYIGYRAKKKADEIQQAYKANDLNKLAGALGVGNSPGSSGSSPDLFWWVSPIRPLYRSRSPKCRCSLARRSPLPAMLSCL